MVSGGAAPATLNLTSKNPFEVLGLAAAADNAAIKAQYYALSKLYHPDVYRGGDGAFKALSWAYREALSLRAGKKAEDDFDEFVERWSEGFRERTEERWRKSAHMRKQQYLKLRHWYLSSAPFRTDEDHQLFLRWFRLWATLNVFEVAAVSHIGRFGVFVERLRESFDCGMLQAQEWATARADALKAAEAGAVGADLADAAAAFEATFGVDRLLTEAHEVFEQERRDTSGEPDDDDEAAEGADPADLADDFSTRDPLPYKRGME
eukprot:TRINITY_DN11016_c0_g1_i1.p1 TRINITY_DN11016_c0_g1~~TRINITY_DN11016_c0_g1_i1.p1  ORF type:complete len:264 (+),score=115.09 TRINITY_DN11016_c0_g1_i1:100-891(+)